MIVSEITEQVSDEAVLKLFDELGSLEEQLEESQKEQMEQELKLQHQFDLKRAPLYAKRNEIFSKIPDFWMTAFENHPVLSQLLSEQDLEPMQHLVRIDIDRKPEEMHYFKITFTFNENNVFKNKQLVKEVITVDDEATIKNTPIEWSVEKDESSFFGRFEEDDESAIEIANMLITDFYPRAMSYYQGDDLDYELMETDAEEEYTDDESEPGEQ